MDILTIVLALIIVVLTVGLFFLGGKTRQLPELVTTNATLRSNLDHTQQQLTQLQKHQDVARQVELENVGLKRTLEAEQSQHQKTDKERETWREDCNKLQKQVQDLTAIRSALTSKLDETEKRLTERGKLEEIFTDTFVALSAKTLKSQQESFQNSADALLKSRQEAVEKLVQPLAIKIDSLDKARSANAAAFKEQIDTMIKESRYLGDQARSLADALKKPGVRGRWGEMQLERILELSGLEKNTDYTVQDSFDEQGQRLRTDVIVRMADERKIILDSKVSLAALMDAFATSDDGVRSDSFSRHLEQVKNHVKELSGKEYWKMLEGTPDMVVMVLPEFAFLPAVEQDADLIEWALGKKVIIVTPPTLLALLKAVAVTWKQVRVVEKAREISELGKELYDRLAVFAEHYVGLGKSLYQAVDRYNKGVNSWDSRVATSAQKFLQLDVPATKRLPDTEAIEAIPLPVQKSLS